MEANRNFIGTLLKGNGKLELKCRQHLLEENVMSAVIHSFEVEGLILVIHAVITVSNASFVLNITFGIS